MSPHETSNQAAEPPLFVKIAAELNAVLSVDSDMWARMRDIAPGEAMTDIAGVLREPGVTEQIQAAIGAVVPGWVDAGGTVTVTVDRLITLAARPVQPGQTGPAVGPRPAKEPLAAVLAAAEQDFHAVHHGVTAQVERIRASTVPGTSRIDRVHRHIRLVQAASPGDVGRCRFQRLDSTR